MTDATSRVFLFLQGPHGPFFRGLAGRLAADGAQVHRAAFNASDEAEWGRAGQLHRFNAGCGAFASWLDQHLDALGVTDIVLYGDTRPVHRIAMKRARERGITTHCFEEGYIRPSWVTYERLGTNGNSLLTTISLPRMAKALGQGTRPEEEEVPATWGDSRQHLWYSARYHARCLLPTRRYGRFRGHRDMPLLRECAWYWLRVAKLPAIWLWRTIQQWLLLRSSKTFHLVLPAAFLR